MGAQTCTPSSVETKTGGSLNWQVAGPSKRPSVKNQARWLLGTTPKTDHRLLHMLLAHTEKRKWMRLTLKCKGGSL